MLPTTSARIRFASARFPQARNTAASIARRRRRLRFTATADILDAASPDRRGGPTTRHSGPPVRGQESVAFESHDDLVAVLHPLRARSGGVSGSPGAGQTAADAGSRARD